MRDRAWLVRKADMRMVKDVILLRRGIALCEHVFVASVTFVENVEV